MCCRAIQVAEQSAQAVEMLWRGKPLRSMHPGQARRSQRYQSHVGVVHARRARSQGIESSQRLRQRNLYGCPCVRFGFGFASSNSPPIIKQSQIMLPLAPNATWANSNKLHVE